MKKPRSSKSSSRLSIPVKTAEPCNVSETSDSMPTSLARASSLDQALRFSLLTKMNQVELTSSLSEKQGW